MSSLCHMCKKPAEEIEWNGRILYSCVNPKCHHEGVVMTKAIKKEAKKDE